MGVNNILTEFEFDWLRVIVVRSLNNMVNNAYGDHLMGSDILRFFGKEMIAGKNEWSEIQPVIRSSFLVMKNEFERHHERLLACEQFMSSFQDRYSDLEDRLFKSEERCNQLEIKLHRSHDRLRTYVSWQYHFLKYVVRRVL